MRKRDKSACLSHFDNCTIFAWIELRLTPRETHFVIVYMHFQLLFLPIAILNCYRRWWRPFFYESTSSNNCRWVTDVRKIIGGIKRSAIGGILWFIFGFLKLNYDLVRWMRKLARFDYVIDTRTNSKFINSAIFVARSVFGFICKHSNDWYDIRNQRIFSDWNLDKNRFFLHPSETFCIWLLTEAHNQSATILWMIDGFN